MKELIWTPVRAARLQDLYPQSQDRIAHNIITNYTDWRALRRGYEEVWAEVGRHVNQYDPLYSQLEKIDSGYRLNQAGGFGSKLKMTNVYAHREGLVASVMKYLMANEYDFFDIVPLDPINDDECAAIKSYFMWLFETMDFEASFTPFVRDWVQYGTAIASYEWYRDVRPRWARQYFKDPSTGRQLHLDMETQEVTYDAPKFTTQNLYYSVLDPTAKDIKTATLIFQRPATPHEIMANQSYQNLKWDDVEKAPDFGSNTYFPRETEREFARRNSSFSTVMAYKGKKEVMEAWGDFSDGQTLYKNYVAEILNNKLIRFEPNPYMLPHKPFIVARYTVETNRIYGHSPLASITGIQAGMDTLVNQYIDYWSMEINRPILAQTNTIVRSAKDDKTKLPPISKDAVWTVRDRNGIGRMPSDRSANSMDPTQMYNMLENQMERATGDNTLTSGGDPNPYVKTGVAMQAADAGSAKLNMYAKTLEREGIVTLLEMTVDLLRQMNVSPKTFKRIDVPSQEVTFNVAVLLNNMKFTMRGASYNMSKQVQVNALQQVLIPLGQSQLLAPIINWIKALKVLFEAMNIRHTDDLFSPQAAMQLAMMPPQQTWMQKIGGFFTGQGQQPVLEDNSDGSGQLLPGLAASGGGTQPGLPGQPGQLSPFDTVSQAGRGSGRQG